MPKTLLAVDDSATMRKVLEITFSGEDFRVITAEGREAALAKLGEDPSVVVVDTSLDGEDGYSLAKEIRQRSPRATLVLLASRYSPYDAGRGREAGADDYMDKPFDTQQMIDKVRKAMLAREASGPAAAVPPPPPQRPVAPTPTLSTATAPSISSPFVHRPAPAPVPPAPPSSLGAKPAMPAATLTSRTHTLSFEGSNPPVVPPPVLGGSLGTSLGGPRPPMPQPPMHAAPSAHVVPHAPPPVPPPPPPHAAPAPVITTRESSTNEATSAPASRAAPFSAVAPSASVASATSVAVNGHLGGKLAELGLTPAQADAVVALSREVVERVVWEVVPQLAETIIREEIARLTREG